MRKYIIKFLSLALCLLTLVGCDIGTASPEEQGPVTKSPEQMIADSVLQYPATNETFRYNVYTEYATISECLTKNSNVVIPDTIDGLPVLRIEPTAFLDNLTIKSITMCSNIISIGESAFQGCLNLESVVMSPAVTSIGEYAFSQCQNLQSISIPAGVSTIYSHTFDDCITLTNVTIEEKIKEDVPEEEATTAQSSGGLFGSTTSEEPTGRLIEGRAFSDCLNLTNVWIPADIVTIEDSAFYNSLEKLTIYGYAASAAAVFGANNRIDFVVLDKEQFNSMTSSNNLVIPSYPSIGGSITGKDWSVKLTKADIVKSIGGITAKEGNVMVVMYFDVLNTGDKEAFFNGLNTSAIASGYSKNLTYLNKNPGTAKFLAGSVAPGASISGYLAYEVNELYKYVAVDFGGIKGFDASDPYLAIYADGVR